MSAQTVIDGLIEAVATLDFEKGAVLWHDDAMLNIHGDNMLSGRFTQDEWRVSIPERLARLEAFSAAPAVTVIDDSHALIVWDMVATREGQELAWQRSAFYRIEDDKIAAAWAVDHEDGATLDSFLG